MPAADGRPGRLDEDDAVVARADDGPVDAVDVGDRGPPLVEVRDFEHAGLAGAGRRAEADDVLPGAAIGVGDDRGDRPVVERGSGERAGGERDLVRPGGTELAGDGAPTAGGYDGWA